MDYKRYVYLITALQIWNLRDSIMEGKRSNEVMKSTARLVHDV